MVEVTIRNAKLDDAQPIMDLVNGLATDQLMLPRSPASVVENIRDFMIGEVDGEFAGCGALAIIWTDIAEIRSIAVDPRFQKLGLGRMLAERLMQDAETLGLARVMAFTYVPGFFEKIGFSIVEHSSLPHKVFNDCLNCPKFNKCDEIAVLRVLHEPEGEHERGPLSLPRPGMPLPRIGGRPLGTG